MSTPQNLNPQLGIVGLSDYERHAPRMAVRKLKRLNNWTEAELLAGRDRPDWMQKTADQAAAAGIISEDEADDW